MQFDTTWSQCLNEGIRQAINDFCRLQNVKLTVGLTSGKDLVLYPYQDYKLDDLFSDDRSTRLYNFKCLSADYIADWLRDSKPEYCVLNDENGYPVNFKHAQLAYFKWNGNQVKALDSSLRSIYDSLIKRGAKPKEILNYLQGIEYFGEKR